MKKQKVYEKSFINFFVYEITKFNILMMIKQLLN